jgi:hypothetical protein
MQIFAALAGVTILAGCVAKSIQLKKEDRETIKVVQINNAVKVTDELMMRDNRGLTGALSGVTGGLLGALVIAGMPDNDTIFADFVKQGRIDIGKIVREAFAAELVRRAIFNVTDLNADAQFQLEVKPYGFAKARPFSNDLQPVLGIIAQLKKHDGAVVWQKHSYVANLNRRTPAHDFGKYMENSGLLLKEAFSLAAKLVVSELIDDLEKSN